MDLLNGLTNRGGVGAEVEAENEVERVGEGSVACEAGVGLRVKEVSLISYQRFFTRFLENNH